MKNWLSKFKSRVNSASLSKGIFLMKFSIVLYISILQNRPPKICLIFLDPKTEVWKISTCELQALVSYDASSPHPAHIATPNWWHVHCDRALLSSFDEGLLSSSQHVFWIRIFSLVFSLFAIIQSTFRLFKGQQF